MTKSSERTMTTSSATQKTREIADKAAASGITPLEFMLEIMRSEAPSINDPKAQIAHQTMRFEAAKAAAPYIHPRLAAIEHTGADGGAIDHSLTVNFVGSK